LSTFQKLTNLNVKYPSKMDKLKKTEQDNNQKGTLVSLTVHSLLIFGILFMPVSKPKINEITKIQVELPKDMLGGGAALGLPDQGQGDMPSPGKPDPDAGGSRPEPAKPTPIAPTPEPIKPAPAPKPVISKPVTPPPTKRVETTEDPNAVAIRRQQEATRQKAEEEKYRQAQAEKAKRKAEDDARVAEANEKAAQAAKEQAAKDKFKGRFGNGTGSGSGSSGGGGTGGGLGNSGKPGSGGRPDGDPDNRNMDGIGRGPGNISGFGNRKAENIPRCTNNSNETGKVVIEATISSNGEVTGTRFVASGSTNNSQAAIAAATSCVKQYRFQAGSSNATGRIVINLIDK
jgi:outer membrane biosynthesis protein TonB